jgi:signal transduction histidine kinase
LAIEMVVILLLDPAGRLGVAAKTGALPHASMPDSFGREEAAFVWRILDCQQPLAWQPQSGTDPETPLPGLAADEVRAFLGVPLMVRDHPVGVLCVLSSSVRVFAPHEIALLSGLAAQGALALDNNRLFTEVERRMDKQHRALRRLAKSSRLTSVGMLAAGVAHDLNNPLCVISNHLQFLALRRTQLDPELQEALASIDTCVQRMAGTIQALLQYARSHGDRRIPVDLNEVTRRFLGFLPPPRACRPVRIELDLAADLPPVCLDVSAWQQVLFELVTNAHEAMPDGGIIRVRTQRLGPPAGGEIASGPTHGVEVRVEDEGIGILPTELNQLFDPFYTTKGFDRVMGMGLWICREVVEEHGGDIRAESDGHAGTRVVIRLPAADEIPSGPDGSEIDYLR